MRFPSIIALLLASSIARADTNQHWLAAQHDWAGKKGFFLSVAAEYPAGHKATLDIVRITLGVADGNQWHFLAWDGKWQMSKSYMAKAVITPGHAELWLDGKRVAEQDVKLVAAAQKITFNEQPNFLRGPADYAVRQTRLSARAGATAISKAFTDTTLAPQLLLFNPNAGAEQTAMDASGGVTIETMFSFMPPPDLRTLAPFIDRFGQSIHASFPGKVTDDAQLLAADEEEQRRLAEWKPPANRDRFGGLTDAGWTDAATGFFRTVKRNGVWWLITPDGNPCFYIGVSDIPALQWEATPIADRQYLFDGVPERAGLFVDAWTINPWKNAAEEGKLYLAHHALNLARKYGAEWKPLAVDAARRRALALGFTGFGKWTPFEGVKGICDVAVLYHGEIPNLARHPDIFDPGIREKWVALLRRQMEARKSDPYLIGWSVGNEKDENIAADDIVKILAMSDDVPARRAMLEHAVKALYAGDEAKLREAWKSQPPAQDIEQLRRFYADAYYRFIYETVKSIDPNHVYLGMWVTPNWWENEADWDLIAPYCDVIGYDFYSRQFDAEPTGRLIAKNDKPVLCGEFSFPPDYSGARGYGRYHVSTTNDKEAGQLYARWLDAAARHPNCVGVFYFQYRDQPLTGRGPMPGPPTLVAGENFAFGIVDVTDRLKWDFVEQVRAANIAAPGSRLRSNSK